ncbi:MAG TPA: ABC transporter permease subunit [Gemmatimonadales bacterium]|nr:ABC transporter permease subunit [Gemmatimonadales bacterium]
MPFFRLIFPVPATPAAAGTEHARTPRWVDLLLFLVLVAAGYGIVRATAGWREPIPARLEVDLSPWQLPRYAGLSTLRMAFAYLLSLIFSLVYARLAAASRALERIMLPLLDILQSVPILSFMPGVVLALAALLPGRTLGLELAAIVLIFTSQAWNMAFSFHQSLITIPTQLSEAARIYRLGFWQRFSRLELPFGAIALIANSMMSWAGGWFFLMASEQFTLGAKDLRLPGLGSYLAHAAELGDTGALILGLIALVAVILILDQIIWRPLMAWSDRFKVEQSTSGETFTSPVLEILRGSEMLAQARRAAGPALRRLDAWLTLVTDRSARRPFDPKRAARRRVLGIAVASAALVGTIWGLAAAVHALAGLNSADWDILIRSAAATFTRTAIALLIAVAWTVPVGVAIGMNPRWAQRAAPIVQTIASVPATAVFPVLLLVLLQLPGGLNVAAVALMLLGTQWYVLFNVIAGASAIPSDLREAARTFRLSGFQRWRTLILPAIFPYLVTGMLTATGGAWNASIVSEYVSFGGRKMSTTGLGAVIAEAADNGNGRLLLAGTLVMALVVIATNRLLWRRLYRLAESRFRLE